MYPKFVVEEIRFELDQANTVVTAQGQTPLFKTKKFEEAFKHWLRVETKRSLVPQIKQHFARIEETIWTHVPFEYAGLGYKLVYSLSDKIRLTEDFLEVGVISELYDVDHGEFKDKLRLVKPAFSEADFKQDVQMIFDENLLNHVLLALHHTTKIFSLREIMLSLIPEKYKHYLASAQLFLQTSTLGYFLPQLIEDFPWGKQVDVRCSLNKKYLQGKSHNGGLEDVHASQIKFREGNGIDFDLGLGCGLFVYMGDFQELQRPETVKEELFQNWRSFFFQASGSVKMRMAEEGQLRTRVMVFFEEGHLNINQLKIFKGANEVHEEEGKYKEIVLNQFNQIISRHRDEEYILPFLAVPTRLECLGLRPINPKAEIMEGYMRLSYDFQVSEGDKECLLPSVPSS